VIPSTADLARLHRPALGRTPSPSSTSAGLPSGAGNSATPKKASRGLLRDKTRTPPTPSPRCSLWPAPSAWRGHPLNRPRPDAGRRDLLAVGPAHLQCPSPPAASRPQLQALERSSPRREGRGHRRPLHGSVTPGHPDIQTHDDVRHGTTTLFAALDVLAPSSMPSKTTLHHPNESVH
jgi:hypothetical protein